MTDLNKRDDALEPCPFCKCEEVTTWFDREQGEKWGYASCDGCAARGPEVRTNWDREPDAPWHSEAIAAWNTRTLPAVTVGVKPLRYFEPQGSTVEQMRDHARQHPLHREGDMQLVWVNEGDLSIFLLAALTPNPVADSQPANPVVNDSAAIPALQARIEELVKERDGYLAERNKFQLYLQRTHADWVLEVVAVEALNAKLTKAVEALRSVDDEYSDTKWGPELTSIKQVRDVLAELEGK